MDKKEKTYKIKILVSFSELLESVMFGNHSYEQMTTFLDKKLQKHKELCIYLA